MGWFDNKEEAYNKVKNPHTHKAELTHELIAAAASYEAAKKYEEHVAANGKPDDHAKAKELLAAFAGAFIDREVEPRLENAYDKHKAKADAQKHAEHHLEGRDSFQF
jgi:tryptophan 2,3-dioxygenase